jgi:uncharacterized membrane protein (UPF0127 family)
LARKTRKPIVVDAIIIAVVAAIVLGFWIVNNSGEKLKTDGHTYHLTIAKTPKEQSQDLGRRTTMPNDQGILFSYANEARRCFLMKGTHVSFDMVWTDANKRVVAIAYDVTRSDYPCSAQPAKFVIALNAGQADAAKIQAGQTLSF